MAPEQIRGDAIDARADLFALGVILYEITVGKRLFRGRPEQVMHRVLEEPIERPSAVRPDYPRYLEAIVMQALERDPERRYQSARKLRDDLRAWLIDESQPHDKRAIATYLRSIFGAVKKHEGDEFGLSDDEEDDELVLEKSLPQLPGDETPLEVDAEDAEELPPVPEALADTAPTVKFDSESGKIAIGIGPGSTGEVKAHDPKKSIPWLPIAAVASVLVAVALYFLFGR